MGLYSYTITSQLRLKSKAKGVALNFIPEVNKCRHLYLGTEDKPSPSDFTLLSAAPFAELHLVENHMKLSVSLPHGPVFPTQFLPFPTALGGTES